MQSALLNFYWDQLLYWTRFSGLCFIQFYATQTWSSETGPNLLLFGHWAQWVSWDSRTSVSGCSWPLFCFWRWFTDYVPGVFDSWFWFHLMCHLRFWRSTLFVSSSSRCLISALQVVSFLSCWTVEASCHSRYAYHMFHKFQDNVVICSICQWHCVLDPGLADDWFCIFHHEPVILCLIFAEIWFSSSVASALFLESKYPRSFFLS